MKKFIALMLALMLVCGTLPAFADPDNEEVVEIVVPNNDPGKTVEVVSENEVMEKNEGTVNTNKGLIENNVTNEVYAETHEDYDCAAVVDNQGEIYTNNGGVQYNNGSITYNVGELYTNTEKGYVEENYSEGTVGGEIEINQGYILVNDEYAVVKYNQAGGIVEDNYGYVELNEEGAEVTSNYGYVNSNNGEVVCNSYAYSDETGEATNPGFVDNYQGVVDYNATLVINGLGTVVENVGLVENSNVVEYNNCYGSCLCATPECLGYFQTDDPDLTSNDGNLIFYPDDNTMIYLYNGVVINGVGGVVEYNDGIVYCGVYVPANSEDEEGQVVYTPDSVADVSFAFYDDDWMTLLEHIHASCAFDSDTFLIEAVGSDNSDDVIMPEVTKSGYNFVEWVGYLMPTSESVGGETISLQAGDSLSAYDINYAMEFYAVWEKIQSETSSTTETSTTDIYDTDHHDISKSNTFFFKRKNENFVDIKVGKDTLVKDEDYVVTAVARDENDTELTATQIEFTDKFFEKYGEGLTEVVISFYGEEYHLYATNDPLLIQVYEA